MNDTNSRLQESLLPIGHNTQGGGAARPGTTVTSAGYSQVPTARFNPTTTTYVTTTPVQDDSWSRAKKYCWWTAVILTVVLVFLLVALKLFLFKPISKGPPKLDNSTAIEPNTKTRFNLLVEGPRNRVQSLTGASVWVYTIPIPTHPKISLAAVGFYVERAEGKRRLKRFQGEEITDERFEDVKEVLVQGGMTETLRVVLATTPPTGRLLELWGDDTKPILEHNCPGIVEQEWNSFAEFFPDPFNKGDEFTFERREGNELYAWKKGQDRTKAKRIAGACMARALFEFHLQAQKQGLINLLDDFFER
jgi:hypothetical protein